MIKHVLTGICMMAFFANSQTVIPASSITSSVGNYSTAYASNLGIGITESTLSSDEFDWGPSSGLGTNVGYISSLGVSTGIITHTFASATSVSQVLLWNGYFSFELDHCSQNVTLRLKDESGATIGTEDLVFTEATSSDLTAEVIDLSTEYLGVKEIDFEVISLYGGNDISLRRLAYAGNGFVVGQDENSKVNEQISVFPNPSSGQFIIELPASGASRLLIYNNVGDLVYDHDLAGESGNINIDMKDQAAGLYHLQIVTKESILTKKVIKH